MSWMWSTYQKVVSEDVEDYKNASGKCVSMRSRNCFLQATRFVFDLFRTCLETKEEGTLLYMNEHVLNTLVQRSIHTYRYYNTFVSCAIDVEASIRHRGLLLGSRSRGPRADMDHLLLRQKLCCRVLRVGASFVTMKKVGSDDVYSVKKGPRGSVQVKRSSSWRNCVFASVPNKKTVFKYGTHTFLSCARFDGASIRHFLGLPVMTGSRTVSQQQSRSVRQRGGASTQSGGGSTGNQLLTFIESIADEVKRCGKRRKIISVACEVGRFSRPVIKVTLYAVDSQQRQLRLVFDLNRTSCTFGLEVRRGRSQRWDARYDTLSSCKMKVQLDNSIVVELQHGAVTLILKAQGEPRAFKNRFKTIHDERDAADVKGRKETPEYLIQVDSERQSHSTRKFLLSRKNMYVMFEYENREYHNIERTSPHTGRQSSNTNLSLSMIRSLSSNIEVLKCMLEQTTQSDTGTTMTRSAFLGKPFVKDWRTFHELSDCTENLQ